MAILNMPRALSRAILAAAVILFITASARAEDSLEYAVKAAYLVKFIPFIDWPDSVFASATQPVTICVPGDDPFDGKLDAEAGQKIGNRIVAVKHVAASDPMTDCQLLFLNGGPPASDVLAAARDKPVVTVTDSGMGEHGIISFVIVANHVHFDIDDDAASRDNLKISSKLLELAHVVKHRAAP